MSKNSAAPSSTPSSHPVSIATFYRFRDLPEAELPALAKEIETEGERRDVLGLLIMGKEGLNTTLSGPAEALEGFIGWLCERLDLGEVAVKRSEADKHPFRKIKVKLRDEIVTLGTPDLVPAPGDRSRHLTPEEWHKVMTEDSDAIVIDTRNWYETRIGKFKGAIDPKIEEFQEFPDFVRNADIPKDKRVLIYCTGGIRCEKAVLEMERQGFENVFQLEGGILAYIEKFPEAQFEGECFVFDHRVAVDQKLEPTKLFAMCPHCGQPADQPITCVRCDSETTICVRCKDNPPGPTCSKNCAHHASMAPGRKGRPQTISGRAVQGRTTTHPSLASSDPRTRARRPRSTPQAPKRAPGSSN